MNQFLCSYCVAAVTGGALAFAFMAGMALGVAAVQGLARRGHSDE